MENVKIEVLKSISWSDFSSRISKLLSSYPEGTVQDHNEGLTSPAEDKTNSVPSVFDDLDCQSPLNHFRSILPPAIYFIECMKKSWSETESNVITGTLASFSRSLALREQTSNGASNQTQDKHFIKNGGMHIIHRGAPLNLQQDADANKQKQPPPVLHLDRRLSWTPAKSFKWTVGLSGEKKEKKKSSSCWNTMNAAPSDIH